MFFAHKQMTGRIVMAVCIAIALFAVYSWYSTHNNEEFDINSQNYGNAEVYTPPVEAPRDRVVAPGGPSAPSQRPAALKPRDLMPPETPMDPQDKGYESAEIPERLRHPERSYSPGLINEDTNQAVESGVASDRFAQAASASFQQFGPEYVQNGSQFLENGVMANDLTLETEYSSI